MNGSLQKFQYLAALIVLPLFLLSCGSNNSTSGELDANVAPVSDGNWYRPGVSVSWQWQLQQEINTGYDVEIYDVDLFDVPQAVIDQLRAENRKVICYFSAGSFESFREDADQFDEAAKGSTLDGFADERWLDVRSLNIVNIMRQRLDLAKQKSCDGVEPDNMDAYVNDSGFALTADDQLAFNRLIANEAHDRGLSVALKNDLDQVPELVAYYDFSINEQCHEFDECALLSPFIDAGKPVLNAEYLNDYVVDMLARDAMCADSSVSKLSSLVLPLDLDDSFRFSCL